MIHLATHAVLNEENPAYSRLVFAPSQDSMQDGFLHIYEIYNMRLKAIWYALVPAILVWEEIIKAKG